METEISTEKLGYTTPTNGHHFLMSQVAFRGLALVVSVVAIAMLLQSQQTVLIFGTEFVARYSYSAAFRFKLGVDAGVCAFSLLSPVLIFKLKHAKTNPENYYYLLLHDVVMTVLSISACAAGTAVGFIAKYGQEQSGWMPVCDQFGKFCDKMTLSIALSYVAFTCYLMLSSLAAYKLKDVAMSKQP